MREKDSLERAAKAKGKAQSIACLSNVKQWGLAFWMYGDDFDDYFPGEGTPAAADDPGNASAWYNTTTAYVNLPALTNLFLLNQPPSTRNGKSIFVCPSGTNRAANPTMANPVFYYGFNNRMDPNGAAQFKRSQCQFLVDTVTFTEGAEDNFPSSSGVYTAARHEKRANLGFADGHAQPIAEADFRRTSNQDNSAAEFSIRRKVYWFPYPGAPN